MNISLPLQIAIALGCVAVFTLQWILVRGRAAQSWMLSWAARLGGTVFALYFLNREMPSHSAEARLIVLATAGAFAGARLMMVRAFDAIAPTAPPRRSPLWLWATLALYCGAPITQHLLPESRVVQAQLVAWFRVAPIPLMIGLLWQVTRASRWPDQRTRQILIGMLVIAIASPALSLLAWFTGLSGGQVLTQGASLTALQVLQAITEAFAGLYSVFSTANSELHHRANERERERHLEELGRLTSGVAHDLNNVLATVAIVAETAAHLPTADERREEFGIAGDAAGRAIAIIDSLAQYRTTADQHSAPLDLSEAVKTIFPVLQRALRPGQQLALRPAATTLPVFVNRDQLERVLLNLVANARDAMSDDGRAELRLDEVRSARGLLARITVQDDGAGIAAELLPRVTEAFFTTKAPGSGSGLGLAMAKAFAAEAAGTLRLTSTPGQGTSVILHLPLAAALTASGEHRVESA